MSEINYSKGSGSIGRTDRADKIGSVRLGILALLSGTQRLRDAVLEEQSARTTVPMIHKLRILVEGIQVRAAADLPSSVPDLQEVDVYLEETLYRIDGGFKKWMVNAPIKNMIAILEELEERLELSDEDGGEASGRLTYQKK